MNEIINSFVIVKEMLTDRKLQCDNLNHISDVELTAMVKTNPIFSIKVNDELRLIYYLALKFKIADLKKFISEDEKVIIIFKEKINNLNIKNIKESTTAGLEIFNLKELLYNISKHELVPKHEIIGEDELSSLLDIYKIKQKSQLPILLRTDPMARYLDVKAGEIVKITRASPTAGETIVYRYCV
tara:strand:+ start:641 stop:1195 length:555 start_codon:yes stop_codon:yes gene_type:complete